MSNKLQVHVNERNLSAFKKAHAKAVKADLDSFTFEGQQVNTQYAKYVIEYLDPEYEPKLWTDNH